MKVRTEYLEATWGLVKRLEISNHLIDLCSYVRKNTLLAVKGRHICTPLKSATATCKQQKNLACNIKKMLYQPAQKGYAYFSWDQKLYYCKGSATCRTIDINTSYTSNMVNRNYAAILSDCSLWQKTSLRVRSDFIFLSRIHQVSTGQDLMLISLPTCINDAVSSSSGSLYLHSIDNGLSCHSKRWCSLQISVQFFILCLVAQGIG